MHPNQQRIETFYSAFARLDAGAMADCYADDSGIDAALRNKVRAQAGASLARFLERNAH